MSYPHPYITVCLLDGCNKTCKHCYRTAIPTGAGFRLDAATAHGSISDASSLGTACLFAGGEPTIWSADNTNLLDLLIAAGNQHGRVAFISNGYVFENKAYTKTFLSRYAENCRAQLHMIFSVDYIHENYDSSSKSIPFLDNLLALRDTSLLADNLSIRLISHWTTDPTMNIPLSILDEYQQRGITYEVNDFMTWGRGEALAGKACSLSISSSEKTSLGPYKDLLSDSLTASGIVADAVEFESMPNRELLRKLSVCGRAPNFFISWGMHYYYCIPQMGFDWFALSRIGKFSNLTIESFFAQRPVLLEMQRKSILGVVDEYSSHIDRTTLTEIQSIKESTRFAGCSVCRKLFQKGILQTINQVIVDCNSTT